MALDVRLSRDVDEPWGFEIYGGDDEMPLTVEKIGPDTPAKRAGLLNGDTILTINGEEAIDMTVETASRRVEESGHSLTVGVLRGLYDPVLDDSEPLCYDYEDVLGQQSEPTEVVFQIQQFVEPLDIGSHLLDLGSTPGNDLSESRSLTASPFVTPTKPYRPFSTEPLAEVPPLEDPLILNPNYRDEFGKSPMDNDPDYLLNAFGKFDLGESKFKLPMSEQYDPDGTRFKQNVEVTEKLLKYEKHVECLSKDLEIVDVSKEIKVSNANDEVLSKDLRKESIKEDVKFDKKEINTCKEVTKCEKSIRTDSKSIERKEIREEVEEESIRKELQNIEKMRQDIDLGKIEETAMSVVEKSIERAVSVAEEVKKEINVEISSTEIQQKSEYQQKESRSVKSEKTEESSEIIDKTEGKDYSERKMSKEERIEIQEEGSQKIARKDYKESEISETVSQGGKDVHRQSLLTEEYQHEEIRRRESSVRESSESRLDGKAKFKKAAKTVASSVKGDKGSAEQKAYSIGLQTIPNIRGTVHSSYHYDLLLRTFFLHLTDVMVALSRFLLSQPIFNQSEQRICDTRTYENRDTNVSKNSHEVVEKVENRQEATKKVAEKKQETRQLVTPVPVEKKQEVKSISEKIEKDMKIESLQETKVEKKEIIKPVPIKEVKIEKVEIKEEQKIEKTMTGAQMAQRSDKRLTPEVTQKLDAVISEFQTIAGDDVKNENRRSKDSDPLEWLEKVDSRRTSMERTEMSKTEFSSSETIEKKSIIESKQTPKQTYIAIVESHVFTNKDAIFEEQVANFAETSSVQSAEEINTAVETIEMVSAENVAIESAVQELETAKIVEETHQLVKAITENAATVQKIEEVLHDTKELVQVDFKKETAKQSTDIQEVVIQEIKDIVEPVVEIKDEKIEKVEKVAININESLSVAESTEVSVQESKSEFANVEVKKETVAVVEEKGAVEKIVGTKPEVIEPKPIEISETIKIKPNEDKPLQEEFAAIKIVKKVEIDANLSPEIIEVEDISELISKTAMSKVQVGDHVAIDASKKLTEKSNVTSGLSKAKAEEKIESAVDIYQASQTAVSESKIGSVHISSQSTKRESESDVSQTSHLSSQVTASSVTKELVVTQQSSESSCKSSETIQESSFTAKIKDKKLSLRTDLERQESTQSSSSTIDTPTPSTIPPTPLTDEYMFQLSLPLPKSRGGTPIPRDGTLSPEEDHEDPHIVKKRLIPHIETTIESVVYDPPLSSPTVEAPQSPVFTKPVLNGGASNVRPVYTKPGLKGGAGRFRFPVYRKPGLFGGADKPEYAKEEIREIERKSSLLASAIDETIKSIEEYKEEVGIDTKKEVKVQEYKEEKTAKTYLETYSKDTRKGSRLNGFEDIDTRIEEIIEKCNALAAIENGETNENSNETETQGIVTEVDDEKSRKSSIGIEVNHESEVTIEPETKPKEKTVKFGTEVDIIDENNGVTIIVTERKDSVPEDITRPNPETPVVEMKHVEILPPSIQIIPETPLELPPLRIEQEEVKAEKSDGLPGFRPVIFDPENIQKREVQYYDSYVNNQEPPTEPRDPRLSPYLTESGEQVGTIQGIVDGLEEPVMDPEIAKLLGKPGIPEEKMTPIISGENDMLREAHVMGLARVLGSHMHRTDDPTSEIQPIKPMIGSLKDSEVIKALNEEMLRQREEMKKKEDKKWTTFLQKPKRPVPKAKFGYPGWTGDEQDVAEPYKVKIVKQAKPKVAPDYKPEDFETGPLPWEERAEQESSLPPVEPEEPILIPEVPEFLEAVDPLKESEVPDLEDTGIPLPPPPEPTPPPVIEEQAPEPEPVPEVQEEVAQPEENQQEENLETSMAEQLVKTVQKMVDPNASLDQQLVQMRAQLAALAQLPVVIEQSLDLVTQQLNKMNHQESRVEVTQENYHEEVQQNHEMQTIQEVNENAEAAQNEAQKIEASVVIEAQEQREIEKQKQMIQAQDNKRMTPIMTEEEMRSEKQKKEQERLEHESRLVKQHPTPRVASAKPKKMFGPLDPDEARAVVLPGGRRWRGTQDVYDEQMIKEMFEKQSEVISGKAIGFKSDRVHDTRINFMKYEKPPVSLDHLKHSEVYKLVHNEELLPPKRVEMRTPVICEADYRERCRSMTPAVEKHVQIPQQFHP